MQTSTGLLDQLRSFPDSGFGVAPSILMLCAASALGAFALTPGSKTGNGPNCLFWIQSKFPLRSHMASNPSVLFHRTLVSPFFLTLSVMGFHPGAGPKYFPLT